MPYCWASCCSWSTLTLTILTLSGSSLATSSSNGAIILQGPHHSAQKSTITSLSAFSTSLSKSRAPTGETWVLITGNLSDQGEIASDQNTRCSPGEQRQHAGKRG